MDFGSIVLRSYRARHPARARIVARIVRHPLTSHSVTEDVHSALTRDIRDAILVGEFVPGQRLVETDLGDRFGASRASARLALLNLANEGLVERLPNRGARVRAITVEQAVEIVEARLALEALVARKAAERRSEEDAAELRVLREGIERAIAGGDLAEYSRLNQEMDRVLLAASGHELAADLLERLWAQSARHQFRLAYQPGRAQVSGPQHVAIIDAVLAGDGPAAEAATRLHLESVLDALRAS
ncbi:MAG: GntR family transcriptional regulator [Microbacteriaceae bacterium]|nr:GntR family transcriptional regulator [Microbacteriaceae bacterium]